ncbi:MULTISPECIES: MFS transporter [Nostocales]|uniref:MFS transporter n=3 Tax=Nostocales TaxID=1161 RepID=A0A0C1N2V1_9CYAN|nr:MFS transporter [Tolypothrix bouteillei]KAF3889889.1 MFS transporter [Tolypothrix bouteillei VB521301]
MWWTKKQATESSQQHDPYAAWRYRDYCFYALGHNLLLLGNQMQSVAIGWELYERTGSALILGGVGLVQVIPVILLTLPAGHIADRWDRKRTVLLTTLMLALCSLGLAVLSYARGSIPLIYVCLLLGGVAKAFNNPASSALLPQLIPLEVFGNAATWNSSGFQLAAVLGPALGGWAIALTTSATSVYVIDAVLILICFGLIAKISEVQAVRAIEPLSVKSLSAGLNFVWKQKIIFAAITLDLFAVLFGGAVALLPIYAKDILQVGPSGLGWLRAAPAFGALTMALSLAHLPPMKKAGKALLWSVAGFGVVTVVFGLSQSFWLSMLMLALSGALDNISVVIRHTLVQIGTPDRLRGRVSAVNGVFISISNELGAFESGFVAAFFGPIFSVVSGGLGTLLVVLMIALLFPEIRRLRSLQEIDSTGLNA